MASLRGIWSAFCAMLDEFRLELRLVVAIDVDLNRRGITGAGRTV